MASSVGLRSSVMSLNSPHGMCGTEELKKYAIKLLEQLEAFVNEEIVDNKYSYRLVAKVCHYLKTEGCRLDEDPIFRQQLDIYFNLLRNLLRKQNLSPLARAMILQVIELRANNWISTEELDGYYHRKTAEFESIDTYSSSSVDTMGADVSTQSSHGTDLAKTLKSAKPTKMQGKTYLKDEVLIRNGDSGKVMGIKGRRVHLIEEMSDTVISFQKVTAGARERVVQIIGQSEENIERAKELIDSTIKRNASPVPFECPNRTYDTNLKQNPKNDVIPDELFDSSHTVIDVETQTLTGHLFTINIGGDVIELSTNNYDLGLKAKNLLKQLIDEPLGPLRRPLESPNPQTLRHPLQKQQSEETLRRPLLKTELTNTKDLYPKDRDNESKPLCSQTTPEPKVAPIEPTLNQIKKSSSQGMLPIGRTSLRFMSSESDLSKPLVNNMKQKIAYDRQFLVNCSALPSSTGMPNVEMMAQIYKKTPDIIRKHQFSGQNPNSCPTNVIRSHSFTQKPVFFQDYNPDEWQ